MLGPVLFVVLLSFETTKTPLVIFDAGKTPAHSLQYAVPE